MVFGLFVKGKKFFLIVIFKKIGKEMDFNVFRTTGCQNAGLRTTGLQTTGIQIAGL